MFLNNIILIIAFFLIIEGFLPFVSPNLWKKIIRLLLKQPNNFIRKTGLISLFFGFLIIFINLYIF